IAATNQDLPLAIQEKRFRQDLYYRLNVARFMLPSLRDRRDGIPPLRAHLLDKFCRKMSRRVVLADGVLEYLSEYRFTGNVRELENMIEQGVALAADGLLRLENISVLENPLNVPNKERSGRSMQDVVDEAEASAIQSALREVDGNREK